MVEVGNFIEFKGYHMGIVSVNTEKNKAHALCLENHRLATFDADDSNIKILKDNGCPSLVRAIYDDMSRFVQEGR